MYIQKLLEKKLLDKIRKEKEKHLTSIQNLRNSFRQARQRNFKRRTNLSVLPEGYGKEVEEPVETANNDSEKEDEQ